MDTFQRSINSNVKKTDDDHLLVSSCLQDPEHSLHLELTVQVSTRTIETATASMSRAPLTRCLETLESLSQMEGLVIDRGIMKEMYSRLGGPKGCTHLTELLNDAIRLTSMILIGLSVGFQPELREILTEEEIIAMGREKLRNTCLVFADDEKGKSVGAASSRDSM